MQRTFAHETMHSIIYYITVVLTRFLFAECKGTFFKVEVDNFPANKGVPVLNSNIFDCSRQKSCSRIVQMRGSSEEGENSKRAVFALSKTEGL